MRAAVRVAPIIPIFSPLRSSPQYLYRSTQQPTLRELTSSIHRKLLLGSARPDTPPDQSYHRSVNVLGISSQGHPVEVLLRLTALIICSRI